MHNIFIENYFFLNLVRDFFPLDFDFVFERFLVGVADLGGFLLPLPARCVAHYFAALVYRVHAQLGSSRVPMYQ